MIVNHLRLQDFRNYEILDCRFGPGLNLIVGENAQGKTNVLEAVYSVCTGRSFRTRDDRDMIRFDRDTARVHLEFSEGGITAQEFTVKKIYDTAPVSELQSIGAYAPPQRRQAIAEREIPGKLLLLKNCPSSLQPTTGKAISVQAMQIGTIAIKKDVLEVWDCGIPYSIWLSQHPKPASTNDAKASE